MNDIGAIVDSLERAPTIILPLVAEVPPAILKRRPRAGKWSAHEHACHLATIDAVMSARLDSMLAEARPRIVPHFPSAEEEAGALLKTDLGEAMDRFVASRARLVQRLKSLPADAWLRTAEHGEYSHYSVFIMARHVALHDMLHAYRIEELLLKKDWKQHE